jgi:hypothetical protein
LKGVQELQKFRSSGGRWGKCGHLICRSDIKATGGSFLTAIVDSVPPELVNSFFPGNKFAPAAVSLL